MSDHDENCADAMPLPNGARSCHSSPGMIEAAAAGVATTMTAAGKRPISTTVSSRNGPPIPTFGVPDCSNTSTSTSTSSGSISIFCPALEGGGKMTHKDELGVALTQEAGNDGAIDSYEDEKHMGTLDHPHHQDDDEDDVDDGSTFLGGGSFSSRHESRGSSDDDEGSSSSSCEDDEEEETPLLSLEERMFRNQRRNASFLQSLDEKYQGQVPVEVQSVLGKPRKGTSSSKRRRLEEQVEAPVEHRGMLWRNKPRAGPSIPVSANTPIPLAQRLQALIKQYPYRESQIRQLTALLHGSIMGSLGIRAVVQPRNEVHVPPPIFLSGPRGTGKTSVVKDILTLLEADTKYQQQQQQQQQQQSHRSIPRLHWAYINCVTLEPSSIERLVADAYMQLRPKSSLASSKIAGLHRRRLEKQGQHTTSSSSSQFKLPHSPKFRKDNRIDTTSTETPTTSNSNDLTTNDPANEEGVKEITSFASQVATLLPDTTDQKLSDPVKDLPQELRFQPGRAAKLEVQPAPTKMATSQDSNVSTGRRNQFKKYNSNATGNSHTVALEEDPHRTEDTVETSVSAVTAFGRSLQRFFGAGGGGSAVLVLDDAERLLTLSARRKTSEKANCLAEMLLLPKVMRLNLTIVLISRYALLYGTRLDNIASPEKSTATLLGSVEGLTIQFPAYKDQHVIKKILKTDKLLPLIIGAKTAPTCADEKWNGPFMEKVIDSFLSALVQFLSETTIDVNDFVRVGRSLWPVFIEPLHPTRCQDTIASLGTPSLLTEAGGGGKVDHERLDHNILGFLGRRFLGEIGKLKSTDLTQSTMDSPLLTIVGSETPSPLLIPTRAYTTADLQLPFLRTCLLLAAYICQHNRADNDKNVFSVHGNGKRRRTRNGNESNVEEVAFATTAGGIEQLKSLRRRPFLVERVFSIFVTLVRLNPDSSPQIHGSKKRNEYTAHSLGTSRLYEDLRSLIDLGYLHPVAYWGEVRGEQINLNAAKFWCSLTAKEAEHLAKSVGVPLDSYLV